MLKNSSIYIILWLFQLLIEVHCQTTDTNTKSNAPTIIGAVLGSFVGCSLLLFGGIYVYKRKRNKRGNKKSIPTPLNVENNSSNHETFEIPTIKVHNVNNVNNDNEQEAISTTSAINYVDYGQKKLPKVPMITVDENEEYSTNKEVTNNEIFDHEEKEEKETSIAENRTKILENFKNKVFQVVRKNSKQDMAQDNDEQTPYQNVLVNFKNRIFQAVKKVKISSKRDIAQNNEQVTDPKVLENFKDEILEIVRQEIKQSLRQDKKQKNKQVSNTINNEE